MRAWPFAGVCSGLVAVAMSGGAFAQMAPPPAPMTQAMMMVAPPARPVYQVPEHLQVGAQVFDGSLSGFRSYLDTKRATDPQLFARLDPQVRRLESEAAAAAGVFAAGAAIGLASGVYAVVGRKTCNEPPLTDPNFAADLQAWGDCNSGNQTHLAGFMLLGLGAFVLGGIGYVGLSPHRSDLIDLVNEHNRISQAPIRLQLGLEPHSHLALGNVAVAF